MINKITMDGFASYKHPTTLETQKKVNLIYGLNGSGKSTISNYLYNPQGGNYGKCKIEFDIGNQDSYEFHVFNNQFIVDNFYEENLKGVFTLAEENKAALQKIKEANEEIEKRMVAVASLNEKIETKKNEFTAIQQQTNNAIWEIKTKYAEASNPLSYCLDGKKSDKQKLFEYIRKIPLIKEKPQRNVEDISKDVLIYSKEGQLPITMVSRIDNVFASVESDPLLKKHIIGGTDSVISSLINEINNSDWVKAGSVYLNKLIQMGENKCPFCQSEIDVAALASNIKKYFDVSYENDVNALSLLLEKYSHQTSSVNNSEHIMTQNEKLLGAYHTKYITARVELMRILNDNCKKLEEKYKNPGNKIELVDSTTKIEQLNSIIDLINNEIKNFNENLSNSSKLLLDLKNEFWTLMRFEKNEVIIEFEEKEKECIDFCKEKQNKINIQNDEISNQRRIITSEEKKVVNVHKAVEHINSSLLNIGITNFKIIEAENDMYQIEREGNHDNVFKSLSEGEKMIISLLYFIETCNGSLSEKGSGKKRIIIIDDPISSLSHVYVFNVGMLLKKIFTSEDPADAKNTKKFEQFFLLTHNMYFFYEMAIPHKKDANGNERENNQALFRIKKSDIGSDIVPMKYNEIQNEYESYWSVVNSQDYINPILQANCMRNIIEYFFGFVERKQLNVVMAIKKLRDPKYQAFYRFINRESHSEAQNIFDFKEYDTNIFKEAFKSVFVENGYENHYNKMSAL